MDSCSQECYCQEVDPSPKHVTAIDLSRNLETIWCQSWGAKYKYRTWGLQWNSTVGNSMKYSQAIGWMHKLFKKMPGEHIKASDIQSIAALVMFWNIEAFALINNPNQVPANHQNSSHSQILKRLLAQCCWRPPLIDPLIRQSKYRILWQYPHSSMLVFVGAAANQNTKLAQHHNQQNDSVWLFCPSEPICTNCCQWNRCLYPGISQLEACPVFTKESKAQYYGAG